MEQGIQKSLIIALFIGISSTTCPQDQLPAQQQPEQPKYTFHLHQAQDEALRLKKAYVEILDELEASKIYWESVDFHPLKYLLARSPLHWATGKPRSKVKHKHLKVLDALSTRVTTQLGILHRALSNATLEHTEESYEVVRHLVSQELGEYGSSAAYKKAFFKKNKPWLQPNHFVRNWVPYTLGALGVAATAMYIYKNPDILKASESFKSAALKSLLEKHKDVTPDQLDLDIEKYMKQVEGYTVLDQVEDHTRTFIKDWIKEPCFKIKETLFGGNNWQQLQDGQRIIVDQTKDYLTDTRTKKDMTWTNKGLKTVGLGENAYPPLTPQQITETANKAAHGDISIVNDDWGKETAHSNINIIKGNSLRQLKIKGQNLENKVNEYIVKVDGIVALITLYLTTKIGTSLVKGGYRMLSPDKLFPLHIKKMLLNLQYHYNSTLHDANTEDAYYRGVQAYYHYKLEQISPFITGNDRLQFKHDIEKLVSSEETNLQKYNLISIMLNRYEFLRA